jgi:hypothetical protein
VTVTVTGAVVVGGVRYPVQVQIEVQDQPQSSAGLTNEQIKAAVEAADHPLMDEYRVRDSDQT